MPGIYDDQGVLVPGTSADDEGVGDLESWQVFTPSAAGTYYVSVSQARAGTGTSTSGRIRGRAARTSCSVDDVSDGIA